MCFHNFLQMFAVNRSIFFPSESSNRMLACNIWLKTLSLLSLISLIVTKVEKGENHIWHRIDFHWEVTMASSGTGFAFGNLQRFHDTGRQPWPMPAHAASRASDRAVSTSTPYRSASPSASRHGSGARFPTTGPSSRADRERDRPGASPHGARIRSAPVGPQEELDWMQALADERNRVETLERKLTTQAGHASTIEAKLNLVITQVQSLTDDMNTVKPKVEKTEQNLLDACSNIVDRYVLESTHHEAVTLLQSQLDAMVVELGNIACDAAPKAFDMSTPTPA